MHLTPAQSLQLTQSLQRHVAGDVWGDAYHCALYGSDASIYQIQPVAVVAPRSADDVAATLRVCAELGVSVIPRGGGTSLSGQSIGAGVVIDFSKYMHHIIELDAAQQTARVEPGVVLDQLNVAAAAHGLQFAPDVATSNRANIGGMIGNNSAGARSIDAGKTVDHVIELDMQLVGGASARFLPMTSSQCAAEARRTDAIGRIYREIPQIIAGQRQEIIDHYPRILRRVSGYNLDAFVPGAGRGYETPTRVAEVRRREAEHYPGADFNLAKLIVGAEGTLGVVTQALVHLVPLPAARGVVVLHFDSLTASVAAAPAILACQPSAIELLDGLILRLAEQSLEYRHYLDFVVGRPEALLLVEFSGPDRSAIEAGAARLAECVRGAPGLTHVLEALDPERYAHVWKCRKAALPLVMGVPGKRKPVAFVEDAAVDPQRLPEFVARFREIIARHGTEGAFYGHASVGCLHIRPMLDLASREDIRHLEKISAEVCDLVLEFGGAMSGEHGDGLARSYLNERLFGAELYGAFKRVKRAFDPNNLMNPGKVVDGPSPIANLRLGADYHALPIATTFDFTREGGFAAAAELCNGSGVCRKLQTGTMCPSFMVTGDEEHSTRGRANALRLALSGALPAEDLTSQNMFETYALCLQCKGCKAECPSNVDVAKLKMEFLEHYYDRHGALLCARFMANASWLNRLGSTLAPLSNLLPKLPVAAWLAERMFGLDRRRPLPTFVRQSFQTWFQRPRPKASAQTPLGPVVLLDDCLTSYCEPRVNQAAVQVLEAAGYEVRLAGLECCGRTFASKGFLRHARGLAERNIATLAPWVEQGIPIVGCEPSCVAMLMDEYRDLAPSAAAEKVAAATSLIDSFLARSFAERPAPPLNLQPLDRAVIVHGHCHQKALVGAGDTVALLGQVPSLRPRLVDSGCCGMAGSFGYEHYEVSIAIGERVRTPRFAKTPPPSSPPPASPAATKSSTAPAAQPSTPSKSSPSG